MGWTRGGNFFFRVRSIKKSNVHFSSMRNHGQECIFLFQMYRGQCWEAGSPLPYPRRSFSTVPRGGFSNRFKGENTETRTSLPTFPSPLRCPLNILFQGAYSAHIEVVFTFVVTNLFCFFRHNSLPRHGIGGNDPFSLQDLSKPLFWRSNRKKTTQT